MGRSYNLILPHRYFLYPISIIADHIIKVMNAKKAPFAITIPEESVNKTGDMAPTGNTETRKLKARDISL